MEKEEFKNLCLNQDCLNEKIYSFPNVTNLTIEAKKGTSTPYKIDCDGKNILLNFYFKGDGSTTIQYSQGKEPELGYQIAKFIVEECTISKKQNVNYSLTTLSKKDFDFMMLYLEDECGFTINAVPVQNGIKYDIKSERYHDTFSVTVYSTNRVHLQGKPIYIYSKLYEILSELVDSQEIIEINQSTYNVEISKDDVYKEMNYYLPTTYNKLCETTRKIMMSSFLFRNINIELDDYSCYVFGALRGLEAFIKLIFKANGKQIPSRGHIGDFFNNEGASRGFKLQGIFAPSTTIVLENCYNYYHGNRHGLFHVDNEPSMSRLCTKQDAERILKSICKLIEEGSNEI